MLNIIILFPLLILSPVAIDAFPEQPDVVTVSQDVTSKGPYELKDDIITMKVNATVDYFKSICEMSGHKELIDQIENSDDIRTCITSNTKRGLLADDIMRSTPTVASRAQEYSAKLCSLLSMEIAGCKSLNKMLQPCRTAKQHKSYDLIVSLELSFFEYACYNNGEKITAFLQDKGADCLITQNENIGNCATTEFTDFGEEQCNKLDEVQSCILGVFKKCSASLAAVLEPLAARLRKVLPCWNTTQNDTNSVSLEVVTPTEPQQSAAPLQPGEPYELKDDITMKVNVTVDYFKSICKMAGHKELIDQIQNSDVIRTCFISSTKLGLLVDDMAKSAPTVASRAQEYSAKLCSLGQEMKDAGCKSLNKMVQPCRTAEQHKSYDIMLSLELSLFEYACYNNGEKLTAFLQDKGADCFVTQNGNIENCVIMSLHFGEEQCNKIDEVQSCILGAFKKCSASLAAALEPLAAHLRKVLPCWNTTQNDTNAVSLEVVTPTEPQQSAAPLQHDGHEPTTIRQLLDVIINTKLEARNDELDLFGKYLVASLRSLSRRNSIQAENDVQNILYKYKMKNLDVNK